MNENRPTIKRVLNVSQMRFQSLNQSKTETKKKQNDYDLHRLNSSKSISYLQAINKPVNENRLTSYMLYHTSELDLEDGFQIQKNNPIFLNDNIVENAENDSKNNTEKSVLKIGVNNLANEGYIKDSKIDNLNLSSRTNSIALNDNLIEDSITDSTIKTEKNVIAVNEIANERFVKASKIDKNFNSFKNLNDNISRLSIKTVDSISTNELLKDVLKQNCDEICSDDGKNSKEISESDFHILSNSDLEMSDDDDMTSDIESNFFKKLSYKLHKQTRQDQIVKEAKNLKLEMNKQFHIFEFKSVDMLYNLMIVNLYKKYWFVGFKNASPDLFNKIHFGDEILSINDCTLNDIERKENFMMLIKNSEKPIIKVKIKRLPYARCILIPEIKNGYQELDKEQEKKIPGSEMIFEKFGLKIKPNTSKIENIDQDGLFYQAGLKYDPNRVEFEILMSKNTNYLKTDAKSRLTKWVITEINGYIINFKSTSEEILAHLTSCGSCFVVCNPFDLVRGLYKEREKLE